MAEAAITFAAEKLGNLLIPKIEFLRGVEEQMTALKDELQWMRCFLRDASQRQARDERIRKWISDIRDLAYDAEDVIDSFAHKVDTPRRSRGILGRLFFFPKKVYYLDKLGKDILSIQRRLKDIGSRRAIYGIKSFGDDGAGSPGSTSALRISDVERRRRVHSWKDDKLVVGFEKDVETLLQKAVFVEKEGLSIASIVGMGGVGKSTLAKKVYNHPDVVGKFECRGWVTVSRYFNPDELLKSLVKQLLQRNEDKEKVVNIMKEASEEELMQMVYERLEGKNYIVVVDDVWRQQHWQYLAAAAFPDEPGKAGRVLITSRIHNISRDAHYIHKLNVLDFKRSWELFLKVALKDNIEGKCPPELESVGKGILEKCEGLPFAILVIGGVLLEQGPIVNRWEKVSRGVTSYFEGSEDSVGAILELSYQDLPPHLKACFLCLSFFKEDFILESVMLVNLWIAEGFVRDEREKTMEEIGMSYLDELVNRNMVQAAFRGKEIFLCRMHDLLHDLCIRKAKEEINLNILSEEEALGALDRPRHVSIYCGNEKLALLRSLRPHVRSLIWHELAHREDGVFFGDDFWRNFDSLRVLFLEELGLTVLPKMIGRVIGLRFLSVCNNKIYQLPKSVGRLKNLQTLDISENENVKVPNVLWELKSLRHLYMESDIICEEPLKLNTLKNLQSLVGIHIKNIVVEHLKELINLRHLAVDLVMEADVSEFFNSLSMLKKLDILSLVWTDGCIPLDGIKDLKQLTVLGMTGPLEKLPNEFPPNIYELNLSGTTFNVDPMLVLERIPQLSVLKIDFRAYEGEDMVIRENGFPSLRHLMIGMEKLRKIQIQSGALSKLERLELVYCSNLEIVPEEEELRIMKNLKELAIQNPSKETSDKLKSAKYSEVVSNIPSVQISEE